MHDTADSNLPPPHVLEALRRPRWLQRDMLTLAEIEALRRRAKENSAYFRQAFADLREARAEARRVHGLMPSWTADGAFKGFEVD